MSGPADDGIIIGCVGSGQKAIWEAAVKLYADHPESFRDLKEAVEKATEAYLILEELIRLPLDPSRPIGDQAPRTD